MTIKTTAEAVRTGQQSAKSLVDSAIQKAKETAHLKAFISLFPKKASEQADKIDEKQQKGEKLGPLAGIPIAVKDNIVYQHGKTTCASKMLSNFKSIYDATVVEKLLAADAVIIGKTNLDEFAMGSSTEHSAYGKTLNPLDPKIIPGGSSGGSAAAVASGSVPVALGSDTGGSIRQPAACCGVVGLKPTYGRVSRYGLVAFASSLDQIGPLATNVADAAQLLNVVAGTDPRDQTSAQVETEDFTASLDDGIKGKVLGVPSEYYGKGLSDVVKASVESRLKQLEKAGAKIVEISLPFVEYGVAAYYIIATAEASSNLARYDGVRYTHRSKEAKTLIDMYTKTRAEAFGKEVKRRILLGTYVLSAGFYDAYYSQAQKVRRKITDDFNKAFQTCDAVVTPTMPNLPVALGKYEVDPLAAYLGDVYTVGVNLSGLPGISLPLDKVDNLYTSMQIIGKPFAERELFQIAAAAESMGQ